MKIYTKTGDEGQTSLIYGRRVAKDDLRVEVYGTVDEANSILGVVHAQMVPYAHQLHDLQKILLRIQRDLFDVGRDLATPEDKDDQPHVTAEHVALLERVIDRLEGELAPLHQFILPGGHIAASELHHARTVVRRAERMCVTLLREQAANHEIRKYVNRLSDLLFVMARVVNARLAIAEPTVDFSAPAQDVE
ncbi:MAG: cob(I)yrinic acid a,c-diamide adenosyltransferase [Acidibacillus sp.]|uniref:Corrinoid adenosyltransferase n=1 Tax=Sulfoacidibacillus ferrooxidans TaxID=2005001 RepID=A0A9X2AEE7_9BACL|nr:cob(I)yrinic acid a,c-diamide adenosyltransferase [Sulfoacidibacillus ferrooxidans]MCI0183267.1 Cob(I)yrinic acid a,c-diamide adenosyltransferase [Sulfoacidibacillus ferrooxidans]MCY0893798.1 cob(I)yrinic acid a,c-diamide adenosyltransferase [Acidibacillus sp.]